MKLISYNLKKIVNDTLRKDLNNYNSKARLKRYCDTRGKQWTDESIELMTRKEPMFYSLIKSYSSLNNTTISTLEQYNDDMKGEIMAEDEYEHMKKLWDTFDIKTWSEYYELYKY